MKINKLRIVIVLITFFLTAKVSSQNTTTFQITPEINKKIINKYPWNLIDVYKINTKKVKYYGYEMGEVLSEEYKKQLDILDDEKKDYYDYQKDQLNKVEKYKNDYNFCIDLIDKYLNSEEKYEVKKEYLIQSKKMLKAIPNITVNDINNQWAYGHQGVLDMFYDDFKSKPNKKDLIDAKESLISFLKTVPDYKKPSRVIDYINRLENLQKIKKTASGMAKSQTESEREVKLVDANRVDVNTFSGTFHYSPGVVNISNKNIEAPNINKSFLENEIIDSKDVEQFRKVYDDRNFFRDGYIMEEINTKEQYFIPVNRQQKVD